MDPTNHLDFSAPVNNDPAILAVLIIFVICLAIPHALVIRSAIRRWRPPPLGAPTSSFSHLKIIISSVWQGLILIPIIYGFVHLFANYSSFASGTEDRCGGLILPFVVFWNLLLLAILYIQVDFAWLAARERKAMIAVFDIVLFIFVILWCYGIILSVRCV